MTLKLTIIYGSVRQERKGIRVVRFLERGFGERGHDVTVVDPQEYRLPLLDRMYKEYPKGQAPEPLEQLASLYRATDAFVIVTGEYNHGLPPALKNLLDHFLEEYFFRPSAIACYSAGMFGGVRAAVHLRAVLAEMGMSAIPSLFATPKIGSAYDEQGRPSDEGVNRRFARFAAELEWYGRALKDARARGTPY